MRYLAIVLILSGCSLFESEVLEDLREDKVEVIESIEDAEADVNEAERLRREAELKAKEAAEEAQRLKELETKIETTENERRILEVRLESARNNPNLSPFHLEELATRIEIANESRHNLQQEVARSRSSVLKSEKDAREARDVAKAAELVAQASKEEIASLKKELALVGKRVAARAAFEQARNTRHGIEAFQNLGDKFSGAVPGGPFIWGGVLALMSIFGVRKFAQRREEKAKQEAEELGVA